MMTPFVYLVSLALRLSNPATPWIVLALCVIGWLSVYLIVTSDRNP